MKKIFAFDLGKASIGYCVREDFDIKEAESIIIDKDHAEVISNRDRRRVYKTLAAHKEREKFFNEIWQDCGLKCLEKDNPLFKKEFGKSNDDTIYNSALLRIALLQGKQLEDWQIYKALYSAIQRRGYDSNLPWANANTKSKDDEENEKLAVKYTQENGVELINNDDYKYPCYYDAVRLGLWSEDSPEQLMTHIPHHNGSKVRTTGLVAPRYLVEKELTKLWEEAQKQLPALNKITTEYFLYGEYEQPYGSYTKKEFKQYRGTARDWQGVLGQKIPRFDNRIIMKCKLLPKRNVSRAATIENIIFTLAMKLKNLRINTIDTAIGEDKRRLSPSEIREIIETKRAKDNWDEKLLSLKDGKNPSFTITKSDIEAVIGKKSILDKLEPLKANISGRSSFCRRACAIMNKIILTGELYPLDMDISEFIDRDDSPNAITEEEIREMLSKIGDWNNLYIPDNRNELHKMDITTREQTDIVIGNITNPIIRNRLQVFRDLLLRLKTEYGTPDEVIFEFVRDGADNSLLPGKKANDTLSYQKEQEKYNEQLVQELKDVDAYSQANFDKFKLLKMQDMRCIYSGKPIGISDLSKCEIDHIYPRTMGGNDALYNRVLCYAVENQDKSGRTPYEWLHNTNRWEEYFQRLSLIKNKLGKKKFELLTSKPEDCANIIDSYNGLAETAQIARVAQTLTSLVFGWGMQTKGDSRHIFVNNGSSTFAIRRKYGLNKLLGDDVKKNRENDKHHALDAICISFSRDYKYDKELKSDVIKGFTFDMVKNAIDKIMPYPYANKKPFKGNTRPLETIYGYRKYGDKDFITSRVGIETINQKESKIKSIVDEVIRTDLLGKLEQKMGSKEWTEMLNNYVHPKKKTRVKKVMVMVSEGVPEYDTNGRMRIGEYSDFGTKGVKKQFKHSKGHKGQILYYNEKGKIKVMPVYANKKTQDIKDKLISMGCKLYNKGEMFYSGCLLNIPNEFKAGSNTYPAGIYKSRTIISDGKIKIENNNGIEILTSASYLAEAKFSKYKN